MLHVDICNLKILALCRVVTVPYPLVLQASIQFYLDNDLTPGTSNSPGKVEEANE